MPKRETHVMSAVILIIILGGIIGTDTLKENASYLIALLFGTIAPDILEPAYDYKHRSFFHSKFLMKLLLIILFISIIIGSIGYNNSYYFSVFIFGYILHLILDATTKMGLPY